MKYSKKTKIVFTVFFILSAITLMLNTAGPLEGQLRIVGFSLFTLLCIGIGIISRKSPLRMVAVVAYWILFGVMQMFK
jgi:hypothetical protein